MRPQAQDFLARGETAILVSEMQEGIFGEHAPLKAQRTNAIDSKNDYVMSRLLGMSPFYGTDLDYFLRHSGVKNLVLTGTSLNVALLGTAIEATNIGYHVVLAQDCVICDPPEYAEQLIKYTVRHLCYLSTSTEIIDCWKNQKAG